MTFKKSRQNSVILHLTLFTSIVTIVFPLQFRPESIPRELESLDIISKITTDASIRSTFATDFGNLSRSIPGAVFYPSSPSDIATLIRISYMSSKPFTISPRGVGHSIDGQTFAPNGVVVDMPSLGRGHFECRINVTNGPISYADVGGEQHWINVLNATLRHGLSPRVFTDYLYPTVGGTLSNAGLGGQAFRHGPQISNVYELDVITGSGEMVTCSRERDSDLFYAVLGGLGQFGVITRARIALGPAHKMVRWVRLIYTDVQLFTSDQEKLISMENGLSRFDYLEGQVTLSEEQVPQMKSSFFTNSDIEKITQLASKVKDPIYLLEGAVFYNDATVTSMDEKLKMLLEELQYAPGFSFYHDVSFVDFLDRVHHEENYLRSLGLWLVPHPWLNLFVPRSKILDFDSQIFKDILKDNKAAGLILLYPVNRNKWEDEMSVVIPDEEIFYTASFLWTAGPNNLEILQNKNKEVLLLCEKNELGCKQYLPHYTNQADWQKHFSRKWCKFASMKQKFDPKALLSPGHQIFTPMEAISSEQNQISNICTSADSFCHYQGNWVYQFYNNYA